MTQASLHVLLSCPGYAWTRQTANTVASDCNIMTTEAAAPEIYIIIEHLIEENSLLKPQQSYDDINVSSFDEETLDEHILRKNEDI